MARYRKPTWVERIRERIGRAIARPGLERRYIIRRARADERDALRRAVETYTDDTDQLKIDKDRFDDFGGPRTRRTRGLEALQREMWHLGHIEPAVVNAIMHLQAIIAGNGIDVEVDPDARTPDGRNAAEVWSQVDEQIDYCSNAGLCADAIANTLLFGEYFHWWRGPGFERFDDQGERPRNAIATEVRVMDPISKDHIQKEESLADGSPAWQRRGMVRPKIIPAWQVTHWVTGRFGKIERGRPLLESAVDDIWRLRQSRQTSWMLNEYRKRLMTFIYNIIDAEAADNLPDTFDIPDPLSILEVPAGAEIEFPDISKANESGAGWRGWADTGGVRGPMMGISQASQLPIHLLQMDYREGTFAGLGQADGPLAKVASQWQQKFSHPVKADVRQVVGEDVGVTVRFRDVIIRDPAEEREAWLKAYELGAISLETLHNKIGVDAEKERERLDRDRGDLDELLGQRNPNSQLRAVSDENP